jgi:hypothetical protein
MKHAYLNNVLISRLYLHYKNTPKKKIAKTKKTLKVNEIKEHIPFNLMNIHKNTC